MVFYNPQTGGEETVVRDPAIGGDITLALGQLNYISPNGGYSDTPLPGGGQLIDGAFVAMNIRTIESPRDFQGTEP